MDNIPNSGNNYLPASEIKTGMHNIITQPKYDFLDETVNKYLNARELLEACLVVLNTLPRKRIKTPITKDTYELAAKVSQFLK